MGKFVFSNGYLTIDTTASNNVNVSDHVRSMTLTFSRAEVDSTCMLDEGISRLAGLRDWNLDVEFAQDFAASNVDSTMWSAMKTTATTIVIGPTTATPTASTPRYRGEGIVVTYNPISGGVGDLATASATIHCAAASSAASANWLMRVIST